MSLFVKRSTFFSEPMAHERVNLMIYSLSWKKLMKICVTKSNFKDWCGFLCQYRNYHFRKERNHFFIFCLGREGLCLLSVLRSLGERRNTQNIFIFSLLKAPLSRSENTGSHHCQFAFIFEQLPRKVFFKCSKVFKATLWCLAVFEHLLN